MKTGRRRPRVSAGGNKASVVAWGRREQVDQRQRETAQAIAWGPPPAIARPAWIRLGGGFRVEGQVENSGILQIVGIRPNGRGGWELLGHLTAGRWYDAGEVRPL